MASGIFYPVVGADDGVRGSVSGYSSGWNFLCMGESGEDLHVWVRFPNINIPQGSVITGAYVKFTAYKTLSDATCNLNCYFNDVDDAVVPVDAAAFDALALTGAVAWDALPTWTDGNQHDTPSLVSILQDIIDRAGFSSGNAVQVIIKNNSSSASANRYASAINYVTGVEKAELHITWSPAISVDSDVTNPFMTAEGFTGIYSAPSIPMAQAEGFTGIDARDVTIPSITVEGFTGIYSAISVPMQTVIMTGSDNITHIESSITVPSMSVEVIQAKQIWGNVSAPMMTAEITERETVLSDVTVPMMTVELSSGVHANLEATAPMMSAGGTFSGQCEVTLPMMTAEIEGIVGRVVNSDISLPMITVEVEGKTEHLVDCDVATPMMRVEAEIISGKIITGAATIPMMEAALTSYEEITGNINASIPMPEAYMIGTTERAACTVLRYSEPVL